MGKTLVKVAAVASSLILVGGLVSYRAGAFDSFVRPARPIAEPATDRFAPAGEPVADDHPLIYGTKFAPIFVNESSPPTHSPAVMGGSKSRAVFDPPPPPDAPPQNVNNLPAAPPQPARPPPTGEAPPTANTQSTKRTTVMSSSKSIVLESNSNRSVIEILRSIGDQPLEGRPPATSAGPSP